MAAREKALETLLNGALEAAAQALADVAGDKAAPAASRVQAATTILRVAGLLDTQATNPSDPLESASLSDLEAMLAQAREQSLP